MRNPNRAANIFGALSIGFRSSPIIWTILVLMKFNGDVFNEVNALTKKSATRSNIIKGDLKYMAEVTNKTVNNALHLATRSLTRSADIGHINSFVFIVFLN